MRAGSLPVMLRSADYRAAVNAEILVALEHTGLVNARGFDVALRTGRVVAGGRGPQRLIDLPGSTGVLRLREARRGGLFGGIFASRFLSSRRGARELETWLALRERGAPLPTPVAALSRRRGLLWECHFGTLDRAECIDGLAWLASSPARAELRRGAAALGRALRRFHDAGAVHGDLNLRNVLVGHDSAGLHVLFVDLDHARIPSRLTPRARMEDLMRLARSIEKRGLTPLRDSRLPARTLAAYCAGDEALHEALLEALPRERRRLLRHQISWRVGRVFSRALRGMRGSLGDSRHSQA